MATAMSLELSNLLHLEDTALVSMRIDLAILSRQVASSFAEKSLMVHKLLTATGNMDAVELCVHILKSVQLDSVVRDVQTTGHLAKFLGRLEYFKRWADYRIVAMPHTVFDLRSQNERVSYFKNGSTLASGLSVDSPQAREVLEAESRILKAFE